MAHVPSPSQPRWFPQAWSLPNLKLYCAVDQLATQVAHGADRKLFTTGPSELDEWTVSIWEERF